MKKFVFLLLFSILIYSNSLVSAGPSQVHANHNQSDDQSFVAVQAKGDGFWRDVSTWHGGRVPASKDSVLIPSDITVIISSNLQQEFETVSVKGALKFSNTESSKLVARTLRIHESGRLIIGSVDSRVVDTAIAEIEFLGIDETLEAQQGVSGGLISNGRVEIYGAHKTSFAFPVNRLKKGTRSLGFAESTKWHLGDTLVFPATELEGVDELRQIVEVREQGRYVTLDKPLNSYHILPKETKKLVPVGNLTRNVRLSTREGVSVRRRAHTMFMQRQSGVVIDGASFTRLGRTDANETHTVPSEASSNDIDQSLNNSIGRYSVHFHIREGARRDVNAHIVKNSVVSDCAKHGIVNHGGHVKVSNNVTFGCAGSHFFAENGSEIGTFTDNLAIRSTGSGQRFIDREANSDFGHGGHGFWMQGGGGVDVSNNYAFGHADSAYFYFGQYMKENGRIAYFSPENLVQPGLFESGESILPRDIPIMFNNNVAVASTRGLDIWNHKEHAKHNEPSVVSDSVFYANKRTAIFIPYSKNVVIDNVIAVGNDSYHGIGINTNTKTSNLKISNTAVSGYAIGLHFPRHGATEIDGLSLSNLKNFRVWSPLSTNRTAVLKNLNLDGPSISQELFKKADLKAALKLALRGHHDFYMEGVKPTQRGDVSMVFEPTRFVVESGDNPYVGKQIFFPEQRGDHVPFRDIGVVELDGLANADLWSEYRLAVGGAILPKEASKVSKVHGWVGDVVNYLDKIPDKYYAVTPTVYKGNYLKDYSKDEYQEGWNFTPVVLNGQNRTIMLYADSTPPTLELDKRVPLEIHPDDVQYGLRLQGNVIDYVAGIRTTNTVNREYRDVKVNENGLIEVVYPVTDAAGNINNVQYYVKVNSKAPRRGQDIAHYLRN